MEPAMALTYFVLVLGSAAAGEPFASVEECRDSLFAPVDDLPDTDEVFGFCLEEPGIAAVAEGFEGSDEDRRSEVLHQCIALGQRLFSEGTLDLEKVKGAVAYHEEAITPDKAAFQQAVANCENILQPDQLAAYYRCLKEYCENISYERSS